MSEIRISKFVCDLCGADDSTVEKFVMLRPPYSHDKHLCSDCSEVFVSVVHKLLNGTSDELVDSIFACGILQYTIGNIEE